MRIALCQLDPTLGDAAGVAATIADLAAAAAHAGADLAVFPELATLGYPPRDLLDRPWLVERHARLVHTVAASAPLPLILGAVEPLADDGRRPLLANSAFVCHGGRVQAIYRKRLLPTYDVFDEARYFRPGNEPVVVELGRWRLGLTICEDIWSDEPGLGYGCDPVADLARGCDVLINLSASPFHLTKPRQRRELLARVARRIGAPVVYVNQVGAQDELLFDGGSLAVDAHGRLLAAGPRWQQGMVIADLDAAPMAETPCDDDDDLRQALVTGIAGYCRKTGQKGVVLGLSGGIDSAVVAALAVEALGRDAVHGLLMPGPYSSPGSVSDAADLASALGIRTWTVPIVEPYHATVATLAPALGSGDSGLAFENLQARLRGVCVMAHANRHGLMALTTGNKSEIAVGYCTIYGDMNGGLAPIGDLWKTRVYALAEHLNRRAPRIPRDTLTKPPSAELRPDQTDQDSLPPYADLDRIAAALVEDGGDPAELVAAGEDRATVAKILRLIELNEWKRRQGAPILRISRRAFGMGRRIPLARSLDLLR
jgi:NAD+ synthetase